MQIAIEGKGMAGPSTSCPTMRTPARRPPILRRNRVLTSSLD